MQNCQEQQLSQPVLAERPAGQLYEHSHISDVPASYIKVTKPRIEQAPRIYTRPVQSTRLSLGPLVAVQFYAI